MSLRRVTRGRAIRSPRAISTRFWLLSLGRAIGEVAKLLSFSTRWMRVLINRYNDGGPEALGDRRAGMERRREF